MTRIRLLIFALIALLKAPVVYAQTISDTFNRADSPRLNGMSNGVHRWLEQQGNNDSLIRVVDNRLLVAYTSNFPNTGVAVKDVPIKNGTITVDHIQSALYNDNWFSINYRSASELSATQSQAKDGYHLRIFNRSWSAQNHDLELYYGSNKLAGINLSHNDRLSDSAVRVTVVFRDNRHVITAEYPRTNTLLGKLIYRDPVKTRVKSGYLGLSGHYNYNEFDNFSVTAGKFPYGWYGNLASSRLLGETANTGINTIIAYSHFSLVDKSNDPDPTGKIQAYLDMAYAQNTSVIVDLRWHGHHLVDYNPNKLIALVKRFKSHPAVIGWYLADEPVGHQEDRTGLKTTFDLLDPITDKPIMIVFRDWAVLPTTYTMPFENPKKHTGNEALLNTIPGRNYQDSTNLVAVDIYDSYSYLGEFEALPTYIEKVDLIQDMVLNQVSDSTDPKKDAPKSFWVINQAFGEYGQSGKRLPTFKETKFMAFWPILKNATGINWWAHYVVLKEPAYNNYPYPNNGKQWNNEVFTPIAKQFGTLAAAFDVGEYPGYVTSNNSAVLVKAYRDPASADFYLLAVNGSNATKSTLINTNYLTYYNAVSIEFELPSRKFHLVNGAFTDSFSPYEVKIYKMQRSPSVASMILNDSFE